MKQKITYIKMTASRLILMAVICLLPAALIAQESGAEAIERAVAAGLNQDRVERIVERANNRGISDSELLSILEPAISLAEQDFPADFALQKVMEGLSKGVPPGRMQPLLDSIHENTPRAVDIADRWTQRPEVASFMERSGDRGPQFRIELVNANLKSLTQQIDQETLENVLDGIGQESVLEKTSPRAVVAAVGVLPDLPEAARQGDTARSLITRAVEGGFGATDLQRLPGAMNAAERRSQLPAASVVEGVAEQIGHGIPASQVLQNLFNGNVNVGPPGNIPGRPDGPGRRSGGN